MTIAKRPFLIVAAIGLVVLITAAVLALDPKPDYPLDIKVVGIQTNLGAASKTVSLLFQRTNRASYYTKPLQFQARIAGHWQEPVNVTLENALFWNTNSQHLELALPAQTEACRFLINYQIGGSRYCRVYAWLGQRGLLKRFPKTCQKVLKLVPKGARLRHCELEVPIPA